jgi:predicted acylesterase/phospholipase RssA
MTLPQNNVTAVILSGGGAHGAYEVGVLLALATGASWVTRDRPLNPDILTGTSIGAYNAAVVVSQLETADGAAAVRYLEEVWMNLIPRDDDSGHNHVFRFRGNPVEALTQAALTQPVRTAAQFGTDALFFAQDWLQRGRNFFSSSGTLGERTVGLVDLSTVISREPTERLLSKTIDLAAIRRSRRALFLAATNWRTGQLEYFRNRDMTDEQGMGAILASSALPGIFPPVALRGDVYVDGGLTLNTPLAPAFVEVDPGADTAHVIYLDPETAEIPLEPLHSTVGTLDRLMAIGLSRAVEADMRIAHHVNRGLDVLERAAKGERLGPEFARPFVEAADYLVAGIGGRYPTSPKTIHRYRPPRYLGGTFSLLNFSRSRVQELIELGHENAVNHDCVKSRCVLPDGMQGSKVPSPPASGRPTGVSELVGAR